MGLEADLESFVNRLSGDVLSRVGNPSLSGVSDCVYSILLRTLRALRLIPKRGPMAFDRLVNNYDDAVEIISRFVADNSSDIVSGCSGEFAEEYKAAPIVGRPMNPVIDRIVTKLIDYIISWAHGE